MNFNTYIGFVKESYGCGNTCIGCYNNEEQGKYIIEAYKRLNVSSQILLPIRYNFECIARMKNGYLIGPQGDLYKCWTDLGNKSMCLGNIKDMDNLSMDLLSEYMVGADPFEDKTCMTCKIFPVCGGGCPHSRVMNKFYGANNNNCSFTKRYMKQFIETYCYLRQSNNSSF